MTENTRSFKTCMKGYILSTVQMLVRHSHERDLKAPNLQFLRVVLFLFPLLQPRLSLHFSIESTFLWGSPPLPSQPVFLVGRSPSLAQEWTAKASNPSSYWVGQKVPSAFSVRWL